MGNSNNEFVVNVFPNPAQDNWNIELNRSGNLELKLFDLTSRVVWHAKSAGVDVINIPPKTLHQGIYILRILGDSFSKTEKIIKY